MKILFTTDWHISERAGFGGANQLVADVKTGRTEWLALNESRRAIEAMTAAASRQDIDLVVHLGDVFDRAQPTPAENALALTAFKQLAELAGRPVLVIQGNHDRTTRHDALTVLERAGAAIVWRQPEAYSPGPGVTLFALPYPPPGARLTSSATTKEARNMETNEALGAIVADQAATARELDTFNILCAHLTFAGCDYREGGSGPSAHDAQVPTTSLIDFDAVMAGHIHLRQKIGVNGLYIGPIHRWSFGDAKNEVGFDIIDTDTGERTHTSFSAAAVDFVTYAQDGDAFWQFDTDADEPANHVARVTGEVDTPADFDAVGARAHQLADACLGCRNDITIRTARSELAAAELDTVADVFNAFVKSRPDAIPEAFREDCLAESKRLHIEAGGQP